MSYELLPDVPIFYILVPKQTKSNRNDVSRLQGAHIAQIYPDASYSRTAALIGTPHAFRRSWAPHGASGPKHGNLDHIRTKLQNCVKENKLAKVFGRKKKTPEEIVLPSHFGGLGT